MLSHLSSFILDLEEISLVEDRELLFLAQIRRPLGCLGPTAPMMLVVKKVTVLTTLGNFGMQMPRLSSHRHRVFPRLPSESYQALLCAFYYGIPQACESGRRCSPTDVRDSGKKRIVRVCGDRCYPVRRFDVRIDS